MRATNLANEFAKRGYSVDILVTKEMGDSFFYRNVNVNIISLADYNANDKSLNTIKLEKCKRTRKIKNIKRLRYLSKYLKGIDQKLEFRIKLLRKGAELYVYFLNTKPDVVIPFGVAYLEPVVSATEGLNCKIFYAEKNAPEFEFPKKGTDDYQYYISLLKKLNGVIVQTNDAKQFYDSYLNNVNVINNPIKADLPLPYQGVREKVIVNFCRMSPQKNLDLLIFAFAKINKEYPEYTLRIYGNTVEESEVEYKERMIKKVNDLKLKESVFILPPAADVHQRILNSAMFVSSSDYEGLSNSMIEAMAIGLPCVCTDCLGGGTREVMTNRENGLIVPMNDIDALYHAMKGFIDNPEFAEKCGRNAAKIREKLSVEKIAQQWLDILQR